MRLLGDGGDADGATSSGGEVLTETSSGVHLDFAYAIGLWILFPVGIGSILIDGGFILDTGRQEGEIDCGGAGIMVSDGAYIPIVGVLVKTRHGDITCRFGFEIF